MSIGPARSPRRLQIRLRIRPPAVQAEPGQAGQDATCHRRTDRQRPGAARQKGRRHGTGIHAARPRWQAGVVGELLTKGPLVLSFFAASGARIAISSYRRCSRRCRRSQRAAPAWSRSRRRPRRTAASRSATTRSAFPILSDVKSEVANAFGIRFALPEYLVEVYAGFGNDLPGINDDPAWVLPMPARYVIGTDGIIAYAEVNPDYTQRPDPSELLPVLDRLAASKAA